MVDKFKKKCKIECNTSSVVTTISVRITSEEVVVGPVMGVDTIRIGSLIVAVIEEGASIREIQA